MTTLHLQPVRSYPVQIGNVTLYLSGWKLQGVRVLREDCTANGTAGVTASYPKGARLTLTGKLAQDAAPVTATLAEYLASGTQLDITVQGLCVPAARLCQYAVTQGQDAADVTLQLHTTAQPVMQEVQENA
ncbi:MAG: hypothetical protein E7502_06935 [Ruminococcus sp.]|jgi:hypothetical protein|nr:hypothetical protein [Ruminococcus sp.]